MSTSTYVINLARSVERRTHMVAQLTAANFSYEFVTAVDGRTLTDALRTRTVDESAVAQSPRWLTPGMIGCALSHLKAYRAILAGPANHDVALVLEDDVVLPPGLGDMVASIARHMRGAEVVLLYFQSFRVCRFSLADSIVLRQDTKLLYPLGPHQLAATAGYLITRGAAQNLADVMLPVRVAPDTWGYFYDIGAVDSVRCVVPRPLSVRTDFRSTLDHAGAPASARGRAAAYVARERLFPLHQLLTLRRRLAHRRTSKVSIVTDRSPVALARGVQANDAAPRD